MNRWDDVLEVRLPLPFALREIKAYLIRGSHGWTVVDAGLHHGLDIQAWEDVRNQEGFQWGDVEQIVLTHYHPDHYGLSGWLQQQTGAPVRLSSTDFEQAALFWDEASDQPETMADFYREHGLPTEWAAQIPGHLRGFKRWVEPHPEPTWIEAGETIRLGDHLYEVLHTPGHADGHLSFFDAERGWLIGGDFLLPKITPNISLWPGCDPNPLQTYLSTLERLKSLPVKRVFPAHGPMFEHYRERVEELQAHHWERLDTMSRWVGREPLTATDVCFRVFGENLSIHNLRFALSETLAHLEYLRLNGQIDREKADGHWRYRG
ncbi:MBL fold metallo-hydrolase [Desmospora profundinema]|uniref:Glyoxylase-like metal-dependent hydrolase (Beta-lactamase superfamily II) n=1 Tax=Desmospora profundinema TaxID=1571184 RepID=A0ABU1IN93_9BACL|nr:MBL fold metallo-hydrolase [Desmospora profundinema]MDR6226243.1 glyoxylase-like metal-dependent hydrolase (beta-lactamase superfamily II) [Desmospora profundinema]